MRKPRRIETDPIRRQKDEQHLAQWLNGDFDEEIDLAIAEFLAKDAEENPDRMIPLTEERLAQAKRLINGETPLIED